jgi:hypothetical protein
VAVGHDLTGSAALTVAGRLRQRRRLGLLNLSPHTAIATLANQDVSDHAGFMSEYDEFDYYAFRDVRSVAEPCRVCGEPVHESLQPHPKYWIHETEPADGHEALPTPKPRFELTLETGKKVEWSGSNAEAAISSYTNSRKGPKVVSWRSVETVFGTRHKVSDVRPWVPRRRPTKPSD